MVKNQVFGFAAALLGVILVSALWVASLIAYPLVEAWVAGATVVFVPFVLLLLSMLAIVVNLLLGRWRPGGLLGATVTATAVALLAVVFACGPVACFLPGINRMMGWFLVAGTGLSAALHHFASTRSRGRPVNG